MAGIYPYEPPQGYKIVDIKNPFMQEAMKAAKELAYDTGFNTQAPIGLVLVKNGKVVIKSCAGSDYHKTHGCERIKLGIANGGYEKCPGCSYKVHAEQNAIRSAKELDVDINGADAYLFGHFWFCESCCKALQEYNIKNLFLLRGAEKLFNRESPECRRGDWEYFNKLL